MRRQYVIEVDADGFPGWNDRDSPGDMRSLIKRLLADAVPHYNPTTYFVGVLAPTSTPWECFTGPTGRCVFTEVDTSQDDCIYCHQPQERK